MTKEIRLRFIPIFPLLLIWQPWFFIACGSAAPRESGPATTPQKNSADAQQTHPFTVMSYNVLSPNESDDALGRGWEIRKSLIVKQIREQQPDILLLQELVKDDKSNTAEWMRRQLTAKDMPLPYAVVGGSGAEPEDIFVNTDKFEIIFPKKARTHNDYTLFGETLINTGNKDSLEHNTVYLPPDPLTACSSAINQATPLESRKTASWAHLQHIASRRELVVANVHLYWRHETSKDNTIRTEQLRCVSSMLHQRFPGIPKIVGGDINAELVSDEINLFLGGFGHPDRRFQSASLQPNDHLGTWNGFCADCTPALKIDHLFLQDLVVAHSSTPLHQKFNKHWPSDHCPIVATFEFK
ncbi:MAG: endonuclease/exonuclease/phosphatase family protein [Deltaproteobacteria bacterium]|nr:endonuclease/exonuclease/phosphatase family protein [Deltaproteobacteria bacterium]